MAEALRLGLVGAGAISQAYIKALEGSNLARWTGMADIRPVAAKAAAETMGCAAYSSHEDLVNKAGVDAVIICTPPATHTEIALFFIEHGIPVLCEKPLSIDVEGARTIVQAAENRGVVMAMASKFRYVDDVIRAKSLIASGVLGDILLFENAFTAKVDMSKRWNTDPKVSGGGVLIDNGTHSIDIIRYLLGPIAEVLAVEGRRAQSGAVEDTANLFLRTETGIPATVDLSWSINKELDTYLRIYGSNGTILVGWRESKFRQASSPDWVVFGKGYDKNQAFARQVENFCHRVLGSEPLLISNDDAVASVAVIQSAYESLAERRWISAPKSDDTAPLLRVHG
ncbi:MAG: Gfo/Idh/MocA family oxidoreductase [Rhodospirillales bacterium]|nr:Gfo/Idh/MocA family oxidoreductase [Rhodospirillales bacterium]